MLTVHCFIRFVATGFIESLLNMSEATIPSYGECSSKAVCLGANPGAPRNDPV